jgi:uncharacterized membrane protein YebE (DUF533 family)
MDPEQLIGSLIMGGLGRRMPGRTKAAIGMGLLGVAIAAIEQISQQGRATAPPPPPGGGRTPPPPPPASPPPPPPGVAPEDATHADAMLLVRAMVAAAFADGRLDDGERTRILERAQRSGLTATARAAVDEAMARPLTAAELAAQVTRPEQAEQVYAAAVLALDVDTDAEHAFLADLASRLGLGADATARIHTLLAE